MDLYNKRADYFCCTRRKVYICKAKGANLPSATLIIYADMTKADTITQRVDALRRWMRQKGLDAFIFPSTDPHSGEYVPDYWKARQWISGFDGSAGTAVVTLTHAALWTDSRYWLAADEQTADTPFEVIRCTRNVATGQELAAWIKAKATLSDSEGDTDAMSTNTTGGPAGAVPTEAAEGDSPSDAITVGIDGWCVPQSQVNSLQEAMMCDGMMLRTDLEPCNELWHGRPELPASAIEIQPIEYAGETAESKLHRIREAIRQQGANATVITQLDDIAWTLNLRGSDVHCTPVFVAYLLLKPDETVLFVDPQKLTPDVRHYLDAIGVRTEPYTHIAHQLGNSRELRGLRFLVDPDTTNSAIYELLSMADTLENRSVFPDDFYANTILIARENAAPMSSPIIEGECPVAQMKTLKNEAEIAGLRHAMLKDGVAMVQFLRWLDEQFKADTSKPEGAGATPITEMGVDAKLTALRAQQDGFRCLSFDTIAGYGAHGAIVHYEASAETDIPLEPHGLLLLDSGAQYVDGTTDITRTIALGPLTDQERRDYTLVLKGHIRLAMAVFPEGATGTQLDVLARYAMWQDHKNYGHGTGHGVGSFLSVHEGPHQFRQNWMPAPLRAGMTITIEPGIYIAGSHGCRTENTMLIVADQTPLPMEGTEVGRWLRLEPLTLCPIDTTPIVRELMTDDEIAYLNTYHAHVREALLPLLNDEADRQWLRAATQAI